MRKRLGYVWLAAVVLTTMSACGSASNSSLRAEDWATISAYHQEVQDLKTQVAALLTSVPTSVPATPIPSFGQAWLVSIVDLQRTPSIPDFTSEANQGLTLEARGQFLAIRMVVTNASVEPVQRFPWWNLRLRDLEGRIFTPDRGATTSFVAATSIRERRPEAYQPGLPYEEAVVFDVPPDQRQFVLVSADQTFTLPLPELDATPSPQT